jgi:pimeloyl-ACP methyl ester carboxylesterase
MQNPHEQQVRTVRSSDGTDIAFERSGDGPPIILVLGAFNDRSTGAPLASFLDQHFTVFNYDRRGRGASGDTLPYAVEREIEDLEALIVEAGGSAFVFGYSSGAILALKAAAHCPGITRLALYEPPIDVDRDRPQPAPDHAARLAELIAAGRRGDAVEYFQTLVGIPADVIAQLRHAPFWPGLEATAHTLVYEMTIIGDGALPANVSAAVRVPTLVIDGGASPASMRAAAHFVAGALANGSYRSLDGQTHDIVPTVLGPVVQEFFGG